MSVMSDIHSNRAGKAGLLTGQSRQVPQGPAPSGGPKAPGAPCGACGD